MRWVVGIVVGAALALAGWGYSRWLKKQNPQAPMAYWDGREAADGADAFVRKLPIHEGEA